MNNNELNQYYLNLMGIDNWLLRNTPEPNIPEPNIDEHTTWDALFTQVSQCQACNLCQSRTQVVFGVGDRNAKLLIVGEAPGFHEDKQGEPFVGRAGQLLNAILSSVGFNRQQVYIANVLKCRPPENRDPTPEEVIKCTPFLAEQIKLLQPQLIVALGRHAAHFLLNVNTSLAKLRNSLHHWGEQQIPLIVSYHPAYLLRTPADKKSALMDWYQVRALLDQ